MPSTALPHTLTRLLALIALLSGLTIWGMADQLQQDTDSHFQAVAAEEPLSLASSTDDTSSDPDHHLYDQQQRPAGSTNQPLARAGSRHSGARLLSDPGLPRAPPA